ncbi:FixH family protein [Halobacillus massiliensis]|uniref:FixH family protein n=1 Tax=Halobacillus massiliensis TaxID=1926286 RepID=UPI0009E3B112|nr:FixH family protein [Halobacillus massiliensis]
MRKVIFLLIISIVLSACGTTENEEKNETIAEDELFNPEVEVKFEEEPLPVGEEAAVQAVVTSNDTVIEDADYVKFEIWNDADGQDSSETIEAEHTGNGVYEISYSFEKPGNYQVIAHTQARNIHTMPQVEVQAGSDDEAAAHSHDNEDQNHDHGEGEYSAALESEEYTSGESSELSALIERKNEAFNDAEVTFEIISDQLDKNEFIEAQEQESGKYSAQYEFPSAGDYTVNIHYEKPDEEIHGHKEIPVIIK